MGYRSTLLAAAVVVTGIGTGSASLAAGPYAVTNLGGSGFGIHINDAGQVAGFIGELSKEHAAVYDGGIWVDLGTLPGGSESFARSLNNLGQVVGRASLPNYLFKTVRHAFLYDGTQMIDINPFGGLLSEAMAINDAGMIAGVGSTTDGPSHGFLYDHGTITDLGVIADSLIQGINASGQVVGGGLHGHAYLYSSGGSTDLGTLGGLGCRANAINDTGLIAGYSDLADGTQHGFVYQNGVMSDMGTLPGGANSWASDVNNRGEVVGWSDVPGGTTHGTVFVDGVLEDLNDLLVPGSGWVVTNAYGTNDLGQIVVQGRDASGFSTLVLTPVPEPGAMSAAAVGLAVVLRRRK